MSVSLVTHVRRGIVVLALALSALPCTGARGQTAAPATAEKKDVKVPDKVEAVAIDFQRNKATDVPIHLTYLPGTNGRESVPVVLLHMYKGDRHEMESLGLFLQKEGFAVIMPDLRGHGQSTMVTGSDRKLDAATMPPQQFTSMITHDMEAVKRYIVARHNDGQLNVDKLCLVGAEMGAVVAVNWAAQDWSWADLQGVKQSKDVRALVLLSPQRQFKNLSMGQALNFPPIRDVLSFFIIVGAEDVPGVAAARMIAQQLERTRPKPTKLEEKTVFLQDSDLKTKLIGSKLLGEKSLGIESVIAEFLKLRVVNQPFEPWKSRQQ
jgi:pimeloyl-ACP methyl ester carboxylesterase